jgi:hypothetical protein
VYGGKCIALGCGTSSSGAASGQPQNQCVVQSMEGIWKSFGPDQGVKCNLVSHFDSLSFRPLGLTSVFLRQYSSFTCSESMRYREMTFPGTPDLVAWSKAKEQGGPDNAFLSYICTIAD